MTYLVETVPEMMTSVPLPSTVMSSPGKSCFMWATSGLRSRRTFTSKVEIAPALSQTNSEMVPGFLPWMRSCDGAVTIASAMSGTVSETRAIVMPTFSTVERPTIRSMSDPLAASRMTVADAVAVGLKICGCCACGAATRMTMMYTASAAKKAAGRRPCKGRDRQNRFVCAASMFRSSDSSSLCVVRLRSVVI